MDSAAVQAKLCDLAESTWALCVVAAVAESGVLGSLTSPRLAEEVGDASGMSAELAERLLDVLVGLGLARRKGDRYAAVEGLQPRLTQDGLDLLRAELRSTIGQSRDLVDRSARHVLTAGWVHTDPELLEAQGSSGRGAARVMAGPGVRGLPGLAERLDAATASFLDVGAGVGVVAIEMARAYPNLHVVGLEPSEAPRSRALERIAAEALSDRVEIRGLPVQDLTDVAAFDYAYMPQVFLPDDAFGRGLAAVWRALRSGGWVSLPVISVPGDDLALALARLRNTLWGGGARFPEEVANAVAGTGFVDVQVRQMGGTRHSVVGRRA